MSPALKSKSKDKFSGKTVKEQSKVMTKPSPSRANGGSVPASAYNPTSGTFHSLESVPPTLLPTSQGSIWFPSIDEIDEQSRSSFDTAADYDSVSNNGSGSGESDDLKDKVTSSSTSRPETIPGCDTEKRDKIRQKNEKKHQRQRERRAQELHEKCCSYLMTRKLESLSQKLVVMGFPAEQATMALILNEGRVEDSVSWLLGAEGKQIDPTSIDPGCNLKIDISEELARISDMEIKFKCSKQEVERVIVSSEGDFEKAAEALQAQKLVKSTAAATPKLEDFSNHVIVNGANKVTSSVQNPVTRFPGKPAVAANIQQSTDDKESNHSKMMLTGVSLPDNVSRNHHLKGAQPTMDWTRPQAAPQMDHRWTASSPIPSVSHALASPLQPSTILPKAEVHYAMGHSEMKKPGTLREPIIMMQRPQSISLRQNLASASANISSSLTSQPVNAGWYPNRVSNFDILRNLEQNIGRIDLNSGNYNPNQPFYPQSHHQPSVVNLMDNASAIWGNGSSNSGWGSLESNLYGSLSSGGWASNVGSLPQFDYTSIDWSHDISPYRKNSMASSNTGRLHETWSTAFMEARPTHGYNDIGVAGLDEGGMTLNTRSSSVRSSEWTSPFAGNDLFGISRQSVTSPTLQGRGF